MELCSVASFAELHCLVAELHHRREKNEIVEDFEVQTRLKILIYLVHLYGGVRVKEKSFDGELLTLLKKASSEIKVSKPTGLIMQFLNILNLSWAELLTMFWELLMQPKIGIILGLRLPQIKSYVQFNYLLYVFFVDRMVESNYKEQRKKQFVLSDTELKNPRCPQFDLDVDYKQLWSANENNWKRKIPLLPIKSKHWLLSPELLYDDLLVNYVKLFQKQGIKMLG